MMRNSIAYEETVPRVMTSKKMQLDFEYETAQRITRQLYKTGLITIDEMNSISRLNKEKFSPLYGDIMPK